MLSATSAPEVCIHHINFAFSATSTLEVHHHAPYILRPLVFYQERGICYRKRKERERKEHCSDEKKEKEREGQSVHAKQWVQGCPLTSKKKDSPGSQALSNRSLEQFQGASTNITLAHLDRLA